VYNVNSGPGRLRLGAPACLTIPLLTAFLTVTPAVDVCKAADADNAQVGAGQPAPGSAEADPAVGGGLPPEQIEELVARIALYPDVLLSQILPAATFPMDIVKAARWLRSKPDMSKLTEQQWDPSILALCNYPDVLYKMDEDLDWTNALGAAFLDQGEDVMAAIQRLRKRANTNGALQTTKQQTVVVEQETIRIVPSEPNVVYVPTYNPQTVYVESNNTGGTAVASAISFGVGLALGAWLASDCDWHHGNVVYCRPGYWGGWGHHGAVAFHGDEWNAVIGRHGAAVWNDDGHGAAWRRSGGAAYRPTYSGRYSSYNKYSRNTAVGNRNISGNEININRNNVNVDRGDRNTAIRGGDNTRIGGDRTNVGQSSGAFSDRSNNGAVKAASDRGLQSRESSGASLPRKESPAIQKPLVGKVEKPASRDVPKPSSFGDSRGSKEVRRDSDRGSSSRGSAGLSRGGGGGRGRR